MTLAACGPSVGAGGAGTDSEGQGSTGESSTTGADESTSTGEAPPVEFPSRLLMLRASIEGGRVLELYELGGDGALELRPLHPELGATILVEDDYEVLTGTELVAFRARPAEDEPARLYVARADAGAPGSAVEIDVEGDVTELAWVKRARTLVVATTSAVYRVEMTADAAGPAVGMPSPSAPADLLAIDEEGMRIAADFSALGEASTCHVASVDPAAPTEWLSAYDGPDSHCYVDGFGADALVFTTGGDAPPFSLQRRRFVDGALEDPMLLATNAEWLTYVGPHGVAYRTDGSARELFYVEVDGQAIGEPRRLSAEGVDALPRESKNGRQLILAQGGLMHLVDLDRPDVAPLPLSLPQPYEGTAMHIELSPQGTHAFVVGMQSGAEYWQDTASLWRLDLADGTATNPLFITETRPTGPEVNTGSIEAIAVAPDGDAVAYVRLHDYVPGFDLQSEVSSSELGVDAVTETVAMGDEETTRLAYSADGGWLAFGDVVVKDRAGATLIHASALSWTWWEPTE